MFAIKLFVKHILTLSNVHKRQYKRHKSANGIDFRKPSHCGSPSTIHTSYIFVNQWPSEWIFCVLLHPWEKWHFHYIIGFRSYVIFDNTSSQLLTNKVTVSELYPHIFVFTSGYQRLGYPLCPRMIYTAWVIFYMIVRLNYTICLLNVPLKLITIASFKYDILIHMLIIIALPRLHYQRIIASSK